MTKETRAPASASTGTGRPSNRRRRRPRRTALCCECGAARTVADTAPGHRPANAPELPQSWWLCWLRCTGPCKAVTAHALINDADGAPTRRDWREEENKRIDTARRALRRRLAGLAAEGVGVEWVAADDLEQPDQFPLQLEYSRSGPISRLLVTLRRDADPADLVAAVESAEQLLDNPGDRFEKPVAVYLLPGRSCLGDAS